MTAVERLAAPLPLSAVLVHQHVLRDAGDVVGTQANVVGMIRLVTDAFARAVNLSPVMPVAHDARGIVPLPPDVQVVPLYRRTEDDPRWLTAIRHAASVPTILRVMRSVDVVQARFPHYPGLIAAGLAIVTRQALVVSIHGDLGASIRMGTPGLAGRLIARGVDAYQRWTTRHAVLTLVTGPDLERLVDPDARRVQIANHQFDLQHLYERVDTCAGAPYRLLFVGRATRDKGVDVLLDALASLGPRFTATVVGPGGDVDVAAEARRRGLADRVEVIGPVPWGDDLFGWYRRSDVLVFPSRTEGVPKVPLEAMSQGLPVVATTPGTSGYLRDGVHGLLVAPGDAAALAAAIERMVDDGDLRRGCIAAGLTLARDSTRTRMEARIHAAVAAAFAPDDGVSPPAAPGSRRSSARARPRARSWAPSRAARGRG